MSQCRFRGSALRAALATCCGISFLVRLASPRSGHHTDCTTALWLQPRSHRCNRGSGNVSARLQPTKCQSCGHHCITLCDGLPHRRHSCFLDRKSSGKKRKCRIWELDCACRNYTASVSKRHHSIDCIPSNIWRRYWLDHCQCADLASRKLQQ